MVRIFKFTGQGEDPRRFTLQGLAHDITDFSDKELDDLANLKVGGKITFQEETSSQFSVERVE